MAVYVASLARFWSVSSILRTKTPPRWRENNQLYRAARALPTWIDPLGAGAILVRTYVAHRCPG